uniref:F-actin-capping protein subunit beta n=1 Tax=Sinocyclocheilus rhinocerous TaxID=307959 RepID=A0A673I2V2_9TELE
THKFGKELSCGCYKVVAEQQTNVNKGVCYFVESFTTALNAAQPIRIKHRNYPFCVIVSLRSPWSNKYEPPIDDGAMPSARLRKLEVEANNAFDQYRDLYFEGGVSSVYLWDLDHGFAGVILIKKAGDGSKKIKGCWDSIHVVEVQVRAGAPLPVQTGSP